MKKAKLVLWKGKGFQYYCRLIMDHEGWYRLQERSSKKDPWQPMIESNDKYVLSGLEEALGGYFNER